MLFFVATYTTFDVVMEKPTPMLHIVGGRNSFFISLYDGAKLSCFLVHILALHKVPTKACVTQHLLVELGDNLTMYHWELGPSISNIAVVCVTPCLA